MNAQAILDQILSDARENASAAMQDANDRAAAARRAAEERIASARARTVAQAQSDAKAAAARMERMTELEERKLLLGEKRRVLDKAFALALKKMKEMPSEQARAYLLATLTELADGTEEIVAGAENDGWLDDDFLSDANASLVQAGKPGKLTLAKEKRAGVSGLVLAQRDTEIQCTYEALLGSQRLEMEADAARTLFPAT